MPLVEEQPLLVINAAVLSAGAVTFGVWLLRLFRRGSWRNPLEETGFTGKGPGAFLVVSPLAAYFALLSIGSILASQIGVTQETMRTPGSGHWYIAATIDTVAKLLVCVLMAAILHKLPAFLRDSRNRPTPIAVLRAATIGTLIVLPIVYVQLDAGQTVWQWLSPNVIPPSHAVLEAMQNSVWGSWGRVELVLAAVVVAPLSEELLFRGIVLQFTWRITRRAWIAIAVSGVLFGLIHLPQPQAVLPLATMGVILGYVRVRHRSLAACVLIHGFFNARTMILVLLNPDLTGVNW